MHVAGPLRSTGITRRRHYYEPRRLPTKAACSVIDSLAALRSSRNSTKRLALSGLPSSWHNFRRPLPPITPGRPTAARACCFAVGSRLRHLRQVGRDQWCNEAESGLRFRIVADVFADSETSPVRLPFPTPGRLHVKQASYMANSFQFASCAKLRLAYRRTRRKKKTANSGATMRNCFFCQFCLVVTKRVLFFLQLPS